MQQQPRKPPSEDQPAKRKSRSGQRGVDPSSINASGGGGTGSGNAWGDRPPRDSSGGRGGDQSSAWTTVGSKSTTTTSTSSNNTGSDKQQQSDSWVKNNRKFEEIISKRPVQSGKKVPLNARTPVIVSLEKLKQPGNESAYAQVKSMDMHLEAVKSKFAPSNGSLPRAGAGSQASQAPQLNVNVVALPREAPEPSSSSHLDSPMSEAASATYSGPFSAVPQERPAFFNGESRPGSVAVSPVEGDKPLHTEWCFFYDRRGLGSKGANHTVNYESNLISLGSCSTILSFWSHFDHIKPPGQLEMNSNVHLFRQGIKPMWEDPANASGGRWSLTFQACPHLLSDAWVYLCMCMVGELVDQAEDICGIVLSKRPKGDRIQVWVKSTDDKKVILEMGTRLLHHSNLIDKSVAVDFSAHNPSSSSSSYMTAYPGLDALRAHAKAMAKDL